MAEINDYINKKRSEGLSDADISTKLIAAGWSQAQVSAALTGVEDDVPRPPEGVPHPGQQPVTVVQTFSTRGLEYIIMFISLYVTASSIGLLLHDMVSALFNSADYNDYGYSSMATASLIVSLPIFTVLFLRLKKAELNDPTIKNDPSRKRAVQLTLVVTFITGLIKIISYIYSLMNLGGGEFETSPVQDLLDTIITLGIAGGIFAYYWIDEHRKEIR